MLNFVSVTLLCAFPSLQTVGLSGIILVWGLGGFYLLFCVLYFAVGMSGGRQPLGYRLAGLRVVLAGNEGLPVGFGRSLARSVLDWVFYFLACYGVGLVDYVPVAVTPAKRAFHDFATGTRVVAIAYPQYPTLIVRAALLVVLPGAACGLARRCCIRPCPTLSHAVVLHTQPSDGPDDAAQAGLGRRVHTLG